MTRCLPALAVGVALAAALAACGSSSSSSTGSSAVVSRAANVTTNLQGYRIAGTVSVATPAGSVEGTMNGTFDRPSRTGALTIVETVAGRRLQFTEVFSGLTVYMHTPRSQNLSRPTGGKTWLKFDMSKLLGAVGLGSLPTAGTDPTQFLGYLRAASSSTTRVGTEVVHGLSATHYRAKLDLDRYPALVPASQRAQADRGVATLESALGTHTMPMDVWIDSHSLVRRMSFSFTECVASQRLPLAMRMDLFDYGPQTPPRLPSAADAYDLTPLLARELSKVKLGCGSSA